MTLAATFELQRLRVRADDFHTRRAFRLAPEAPLPLQEYQDSPHVNDSPTRIRRAYYQLRLLHE